MDVTSIMTANPVCCTRDTPLCDVAKMMVDHDCGQIPVVESKDDKTPVGVVTDRDIAIRIVAKGRDANSATAADAMSTPCKSVTTTTSLHDCVCLMEAEMVRRIPVVDAQGKLAGIVSIADIALAGKEKATAEVVTSVSAPTTKS